MTYTLHRNGSYTKGALEGLLPNFVKVLDKVSISKEGNVVIRAENGNAYWGLGATPDDKLTVLRETNINVVEVKTPSDLETFADRIKSLRQDLLCQFDGSGVPLEVPEFVTMALNSLDNAACLLHVAQFKWSREIGGRR